MSQIIPESIEIVSVLPNAGSVLAVVNTNVITNLKKDVTPDLELPSQWRLAKFVISERGILNVYLFNTQ